MCRKSTAVQPPQRFTPTDCCLEQAANVNGELDQRDEGIQPVCDIAQSVRTCGAAQLLLHSSITGHCDFLQQFSTVSAVWPRVVESRSASLRWCGEYNPRMYPSMTSKQVRNFTVCTSVWGLRLQYSPQRQGSCNRLLCYRGMFLCDQSFIKPTPPSDLQ